MGYKWWPLRKPSVWAISDCWWQRCRADFSASWAAVYADGTDVVLIFSASALPSWSAVYVDGRDVVLTFSSASVFTINYEQQQMLMKGFFHQQQQMIEAKADFSSTSSSLHYEYGSKRYTIGKNTFRKNTLRNLFSPKYILSEITLSENIFLENTRLTNLL